MTIDTVRQICHALPAVIEDIKWGSDLCFCVAGKMFAVVNLELPHSIAFKCTPESFGELTERPGIRPAPYMARNMWVQEQQLGDVLERHELEPLIRTSYELVVAKMPRSRRPEGAGTVSKANSIRPARKTRVRTRRKPASSRSARRRR